MEAFSASLSLCAGNSPVTCEFPHKGQWREALMFSLICAWINSWVNNGDAGNLKRHRAHYDVIVMCYFFHIWSCSIIADFSPVIHILYIYTFYYTMDLLREKFQWILLLYMKPISFQSKASVVCSITAATSMYFYLRN